MTYQLAEVTKANENRASVTLIDSQVPNLEGTNPVFYVESGAIKALRKLQAGNPKNHYVIVSWDK